MHYRRSHLKPLLDALEGKQPENEAVRLVAVYAVIPGAIIGLLLSALAVPKNAPENDLLLWGTLGGIAGGVGALLLTMLVHRLLGFRFLSTLVYSFMGGLGGLAFGATIARHSSYWWVVGMAIAGAIVLPLICAKRSPTNINPRDPNQRSE